MFSPELARVLTALIKYSFEKGIGHIYCPEFKKTYKAEQVRFAIENDGLFDGDVPVSGWTYSVIRRKHSHLLDKRKYEHWNFPLPRDMEDLLN